MDKSFTKIISTWYKRGGATAAAIIETEQALGVVFPETYKEFLLWSNGGEGTLGENYVYIWAIEDIVTYNADYEIRKYLKGDYVAFGMSGDVGFVFYLPDQSICMTGFGDLDTETLTHLASSFGEFLGKALYMDFEQQ